MIKKQNRHKTIILYISTYVRRDIFNSVKLEDEKCFIKFWQIL